MAKDLKKLKKYLCIFSYYWLLLKYYHIIQKLKTPIGFKKMFSGLAIKFHRKIYGLKDFDALFLALFYGIFCFCMFFCCCFNSHKTYCDFVLITYA